MKRLVFLLFLVPQAEAEFEAPDGLEVTVWAESPHLFNPTNIDIDSRGRIWVTEGVNYRNTHRRPGMKQHPEGDRVMILEDTDGDGKCDSSKVFAQSPDLLVPLGVAVLGDTILVSCSPSVIRYRDTNGDDKPDETEVFLKRFGGRDHDHGVHAFVAGPDGRLYFNAGNLGPHTVTDKSGWTLRSGSYSGGGRNRKSDDGRVWVGGLAMRIEPDGDKLAVLAHNFRNNFELSLDSYGNIWQSDNDDDGHQCCRMTWVMEGGNYGYSSNDGGRAWNVDQRPGQSTQTAHWHQEDPGVCPTVEITGAGGPTGVVVYEGELMPKYRGAVFGCDAGRSVVFGYFPKPDGAGYRFDRFALLASKGDKKNLFRPSDVAVGIDGAIYVSDWYDPVVGGHDMKDKTGKGRILRIAPKGVKPTIRTGLDSPAVNVRFGKKDKTLLDSPDPILRARSLWQADKATQARALKDKDSNIRITAYRALRDPTFAVELVADPSPAVRREVAISLRDVPGSQELLLKLIEQYDGKDRWYLEALGIGCEGKEEEIGAELLKRGGPVDVLWRLHPVSSIPFWVARKDRQALSALAFIPHPDAANAMVDLALYGPPEIRDTALWWARHRSRNEWKAFDFAGRLPKTAEARAKLESAKKAVMEGSADAARKLAADREGALYLIHLAAEEKLSQDLRGVIAEEIFKNPDLGVRALASEHFKRPGGAELPAVGELEKTPGRAEQGRKVFFGPSANCSRCHVFEGEGRAIGPELTRIRDKLGKAGLFDAILNPSAGIAFGYENWVIVTKSKEVYSGFILADGDTVVLKESTGEQRSLAAADIETRKKSTLSIMPDNVALGLTAQELADLIEFLRSGTREY